MVTEIRIKHILQLVELLKSEGMSRDEVENLRILLGDDEELNGVHPAYFAECVTDGSDLVELIEECGIAFDGKAILIS